jgi:hypothetical protein
MIFYPAEDELLELVFHSIIRLLLPLRVIHPEAPRGRNAANATRHLGKSRRRRESLSPQKSALYTVVMSLGSPCGAVGAYVWWGRMLGGVQFCVQGLTPASRSPHQLVHGLPGHALYQWLRKTLFSDLDLLCL